MLVCDDKGLTGYGADGQVTRFDVEDEIKVPCGINLPPSGWFLRELTHFVQCAERNVPMTNYGIAIAHMHGILDRALAPFPDLHQAWSSTANG